MEEVGSSNLPEPIRILAYCIGWEARFQRFRRDQFLPRLIAYRRVAYFCDPASEYRDIELTN
jgi:hypothetical protein